MAKFRYSSDDKDAIKEVKRAINGKTAILKDKGNTLVVGSPMMTVTIRIGGGMVETSGSLAGKLILSTIDSCIELADGFEKL